MEARCPDILGTRGLRPWRAAPASGRQGPSLYVLGKCLALRRNTACFDLPSRYEPLVEGVTGREKALTV
nr:MULTISPECIES: hypothetical protein [unclassified Thioalkalivibrio]